MLKLQNQVLKNSRIKTAVPLSLLIHIHHDIWQFSCFSEVETLHSDSILFHHREKDQSIQTILTSYLMNAIPGQSGCWNPLILLYVIFHAQPMLLHTPICSFGVVNLHWELLPKNDVTWCAELSASMCSVCMYLT